jgi:flavin reductase (DIM6/NTAB) family NADH-FMN oxidoreductase RutF
MVSNVVTDPSAETMRAVHRQFLTGVAILTTSAGGEPRGLTLNALASVSVDPPVILVCIARTASTHEWLFRSDHFAINTLAADQADVARAFARSTGAGKFDTLAWTPARFASPMIDGVAACMEAEVETRLQAYTHTIFVARVREAHVYDRPPLAYVGGRFFDASALYAAEIAG